MILLPRRQQQAVEAIITQKVRGLPFNGEILPQEENLDIAQKDLKREFVEQRADIAIASDDNDDVPFAQVAVLEGYDKTCLLIGGYRVTIDEADTFRLASLTTSQTTNILQYRVDALNQALEEKKHLIGAYGVPELGIKGMLNNDFDLQVNTVDPSTLSPSDLLSWLNINYSRIRRETRLVEKPNFILVTEALDTLISTSYFSTGEKSVADVFIDSNRRKGLIGMMAINELDSSELERFGVHSPGTNMDRMMIYGLDRRNLHRRVSVKRQYPPEYRRRGYDHYVSQRVSGVIVDYEGSGKYIDYPKAV